MGNLSGGSCIGYYLLFACLLHAQFRISKCASNGDCAAEELQAILQFKRGLVDPLNLLSSWRGQSCCQWRGLSCDNNSIISIDLHNPYPNTFEFWNLSGRVDPSLLQLKFLSHLDLSNNNFNGLQIPEFVGSMKKLKYVNLSNAGFAGKIPSSLGNLSELQSLDLSSTFQTLSVDSFQWVIGLNSLEHLVMSRVDFSQIGSEWVRVLNRLPSLTLLGLQACGLTRIAYSLPYVNFTSLAFVDISFNSFNSEIPYWFQNLRSLVHLDISSAGFRGLIPVGLSLIPSLRYLDLSMNGNLTADCFKLLNENWRQIQVLNLASNKIYGRIPDSIGNISSLIELNLFSNEIEGGIPSSIGKLCNLQVLVLDGNNLTVELPHHLEVPRACNSKYPLPKLSHLSLGVNKLSGILPEWIGELRNIELLDVSYNLIQGPIPSSLSKLTVLKTLNLAGNQFNGTLPPSIGQLSKLTRLDISSNHLAGAITSMHFSRLSDLKQLLIGFNSLRINIRPTWFPPFQVTNLGLGSCQLGPQFPSWLQNQKELMFLDLSNSSISGKIPTWFWDLTSNLCLLNISFNQIKGQLPELMKVDAYADVDMRSNLLSGPLPVLSNFVELLDLSHNQFSGPIPHDFAEMQPSLISLSLSNNNLSGEIPASVGLIQYLQVLDLSRNNLIGKIPTSLENCSYLKALVLDHNSFTGTIPSLGNLQQLQSLHLSNNMLHGVIPPSLKSISTLQTLDLGNNRLQGVVPTWLGESFPALQILRLRRNQLSGEIPDQLTKLSSLQVLDLAGNNLGGRIPRSFGGLKAMARPQKVNKYLFYGFYRGTYYEETLSVMVSNKDLVFTKTLSLLTSIDLSENKLSGDVPRELMNLSGLLVLNLSRNQFDGEVLGQIGQLHELLSLDLSSNHFNGRIPSSLTSMSFLSYLNLSNNNFSGRVPFAGQLGTFDASAYAGNPYLCGLPLNVSCEEDAQTGFHGGADDNERIFEDEWFYVSVGVGFAVGLLGLFGVISIRRKWSNDYFEFVDCAVDMILKAKKVFPGSRDQGKRSRRTGQS
ncbi:LRR receptor-like serine/threonine-protein kinase FLS2 [Canna indica]|uniref:LRR receptor-like serine/threonine-protein kinase FLS2 n=1 Tax=Canna indica TaxID=4628 RepID=A0AAQ3KI85_9LILI|nr:LRR receptor-like serine/threonine-protein kinase FLS2 [Canna indica]